MKRSSERSTNGKTAEICPVGEAEKEITWQTERTSLGERRRVSSLNELPRHGKTRG